MVSNLLVTRQGVLTQPENRKKSVFKNQVATASYSRTYAPCPLSAHRAYASPQIKFGRLLSEHASYGAAVDAVSKKVNFKIPSFADAKKVFVQVKEATQTGYTPMWAEGLFETKRNNETQEVEQLIPAAGTKIIELTHKGKGIFEHLADAADAKHGQEYRFIIVDKNNQIACVKDPYSKKQRHVNSWSEIHDHSTFQWSKSEALWQAGKNPKRLSREHKYDGLLNPEDLKIRELHIGTLTKEGTLKAAKKELIKIARDGNNAVQIMSLEVGPGTFGWGYDPPDKHATLKPEEVKKLFAFAHKLGLNVILDYVPNHLGPEGNHLAKTGPFLTQYNTEHGAQLNYEGEGFEHTRDWIANASLNWIKDYHVDGLRADMTKLMSSDNAMKCISAEVHPHHPKVILIAEDGRFGPGGFGDDPRVTTPLRLGEERFSSEQNHATYIGEVVMRNKADLSNLGFDFQYGYVGQKDILAAVFGNPYKDHIPHIRNLFEAMKSDRVLHAGETHDDPSNDDGFGVLTKVVALTLDVYNPTKIDFSNPDTNFPLGHRANNFVRKLVETVVTGAADKMTPAGWEAFQRENYFIQPITVDRAKEALETGIQRKKLHDAIISLSKGPQIKFRQQTSYAPFYFFRDLEDPNDVQNLYKEKGYRPDNTFEPSKTHALLGEGVWREKLIGIDKMNAKFNHLSNSIPALSSKGEYVGAAFHDMSGVMGIHRSDGNGSEVFAVVNISQNGWDKKSYAMDMPPGQWKQILNSDSKEFAGSGNYENDIVEGGRPLISIPAGGVLVFERVKPTEVQKPVSQVVSK